MPSGRPCTQGAPCLIVVVEDQEQTLNLFEAGMLDEPRFRMIQARSLDDLREKIAAHPDIEAVVLDLGLGSTFGADTLKGALEITRHRIPVIILTGGADLDEDEALEMGAFAFCEKTRIDLHALLKIVRGAISHQRFINSLLDQIEAFERSMQTPDKSAGLKAAEDLRKGLGDVLKLLKPA